MRVGVSGTCQHMKLWTQNQECVTFAAVAGTLSAAAIGASATSSSAARHVDSVCLGVGFGKGLGGCL